MSRPASVEHAPVSAIRTWTRRLAQTRAATAAAIGQVMQYLRGRLWPSVARGARGCYGYTCQRVLPGAAQGLRRGVNGTVGFYNRHRWVQRCGSTLNKKAIGLGVAMLAAKLVSGMVETRQMSNLWGLVADKPLVSETTFTVLLFTVEYVVALIVFALIDYSITAFRQRRTERQAA